MYADFAHASFSLDGRRIIGGLADEKIATLPMNPNYRLCEREVAVEGMPFLMWF